jgi:tRNA synthetases class I (E and Q), anti-codon binding domain
MEAVNNPEDPNAGTRKVPFPRILYIEQDDFRENPSKQYYRLFPGREVRLRYGYFVTCTSVVKDDKGEPSRCIAPTIPPAEVAIHLTDERWSPRFIGFLQRTRWMRKCTCTTSSSPSRISMKSRKARILPPT